MMFSLFLAPVAATGNFCDRCTKYTQGGDTQALTVGRSATTVKVQLNSCQVNGQGKNFQPTIEKY